METCTAGHPCSRPDADGWVYEYWADSGGEYRGKKLRHWRMSTWYCPNCQSKVSTRGTPPAFACPGCGTSMVFQSHVTLRKRDVSVTTEYEEEKRRFQVLLDAVTLASITMMEFRPAAVSLGGTFTFNDRMALQSCWNDLISAQKRLLKIRTRQGWDG